MPRRKTILATGETYHIYNRSLSGQPIFQRKQDFAIFFAATHFYLQTEPPVKFSHYRRQIQKYPLHLEKL